MRMQQAYPQDIQCVIDSDGINGAIYVGNLQASQNLKTLKKYQIGSILTAAKGIYLNHPKQHIPYHFYVPGEDHQRFNLSIYFDKAVEFITQTTKKTNILIHCMAGISRSVSLLIAYLIKEKGMTYQQAYISLKKRRRIINPNPGFARQLKLYQKQHKQTKANENITQSNYQNHTFKKNIYPQQKQTTKMYQSHYKNAPRTSYDNKYINYQRYKSKQTILPLKQKQQIKIQKNNNRSFDQLNKKLDQRISQIRKKYAQLTNNVTIYKLSNNNFNKKQYKNQNINQIYNDKFNKKISYYDKPTYQKILLRKNTSLGF